ncbi:MAG: PEP-CTERM sorting domain-containing protein [Verrucomicrobiaceae bacterium]|nr:PEP-CTERM sorting domain-containing protein [Verrucomicrobiaceae bacterium]
MIYLRHLLLGLTLAVLATGAGRANDLFNNNPLPGSLIDLSDDGNAPTFLTFSDGHNIVEGSMGWNGVTLDADIWTFTVAAGYEVSEINLVTYNGSNPTFPNGHFMALASGSTINTTDATNHLSNGLWREELDINLNTKTDLLAILQAGPEFGGIGFTGNLQAGTYTFWVQDTTDFVNQYCIDFVITPVPEPGSALLMGVASLLCLRRRRPRK